MVAAILTCSRITFRTTGCGCLFEDDSVRVWRAHQHVESPVAVLPAHPVTRPGSALWEMLQRALDAHTLLGPTSWSSDANHGRAEHESRVSGGPRGTRIHNQRVERPFPSKPDLGFAGLKGSEQGFLNFLRLSETCRVTRLMLAQCCPKAGTSTGARRDTQGGGLIGVRPRSYGEAR